MGFKTVKVYALATLLFVPLCSFAQEQTPVQQNNNENTRVEVKFKQRHSKPVNDLYADGIKIKRDLSLIKEAQEERILDMDEIPSDELYGGIWNNRNVNIYGSLENIPQTFNVDLSNFTMPIKGKEYITSKYGFRHLFRSTRMHAGVDLKVQVGDTIYAAFDGKVRVTQYERRGYGYYVVLRHLNGLETVYGHLSKFLVQNNQVVRSGDPIALGGNTGRSTGSHLHFELRFLGRTIDPTNVIDFDKKICYNDHYMVIVDDLWKPGQRMAGNTSSKYIKKASTNKYATGTIKYYRIRKGDTLATIAKKYGISIGKLCSLNSMSTKEKLRIGKSLRVS